MSMQAYPEVGEEVLAAPEEVGLQLALQDQRVAEELGGAGQEHGQHLDLAQDAVLVVLQLVQFRLEPLCVVIFLESA
jgi:hypothetical protein